MKRLWEDRSISEQAAAKNRGAAGERGDGEGTDLNALGNLAAVGACPLRTVDIALWNSLPRPGAGCRRRRGSRCAGCRAVRAQYHFGRIGLTP